MNNYGIDIWADDNFIIEDGVVKVNEQSKPSLISLVKDIRSRDFKGPLLLRFPHLIKKQIDKLYTLYDNAINEY